MVSGTQKYRSATVLYFEGLFFFSRFFCSQRISTLTSRGFLRVVPPIHEPDSGDGPELRPASARQSGADADAGEAPVLQRGPDAEASLGPEAATAPGACVSCSKGVLSAAAPDAALKKKQLALQ